MEYYIRKCMQIDTYAKYARFEVTDDCSTVAYLKLLISGPTTGSGRPETITILNPYREEIGYIKNGNTLYLGGEYVDGVRRYSNAPERKGGSLFMYALKYAIKQPVDDYLLKEKQWKLVGDHMYRKDGSVACTLEHHPRGFLQKECLQFDCDSDDFYLGLLFACYNRYSFLQVVI